MVSVDGDGDVRRCHVVPARIGNLYDVDFDAALTSRPCPLAQCRCHVGYAHMPHRGFRELFGAGLLERALPLDTASVPVGSTNARPRLATRKVGIPYNPLPSLAFYPLVWVSQRGRRATARLFQLSDEAWAQIEPHLPHGHPGKPRVDDRRVISGILHSVAPVTVHAT
ncbi:hypothetical protein FHU13_004760 [Methylobacterium sp. R2-1]|nr:hypothetical protein [Methylobacterium sp. R2-1]